MHRLYVSFVTYLLESWQFQGCSCQLGVDVADFKRNPQVVPPIVVTLFDDPCQDQQVDLETVALVTSWAIFGTGFQCFRQWDEQMMDLPPEELARQATRVLMSGIEQALPAFSLT